MCSLWAVGMLLTACNGDADEQTVVPQDGTPIAFNAIMGGMHDGTVTRTPANSIENNATLDSEGGFGVFACYTGLHGYSDSNVHPDFMYNEQVTSEDDGATWTYSPIKYWPNGEGNTNSSLVTGENPHYVSFMAYAPYSDGSVYCIPSFSLQGEVGNPWLTYRIHRDVSQQVDLLYARPLLDQLKPSTGEKLQFQFEHALACVGDKIDIACSSDMQGMLNDQLDGIRLYGVEVLLTSLTIDYTLTEKGRLVLWNNNEEANWQTILSENPTISLPSLRIVSSGSPQTVFKKKYNTNATVTTWENSNNGVYYIPIEFESYPQTAKVSVTYTVRYYTNSELTAYTDDPAVTGVATLTLNKYPDAYQSGKHLYLNVNINMVAMTLTAAIQPWVIEEHDVTAELQ